MVNLAHPHAHVADEVLRDKGRSSLLRSLELPDIAQVVRHASERAA